MLKHELRRNEGILVLRPEAPLEATDFQGLAQEIDPYIEDNGALHGVMIDAESFPGWKDFAALVAHLRFIKNHHQKIRKVAVAPKIASHFVQADVRHFPPSLKEEALRWLQCENQ
jgi:hypothetical protein